MTVQTHPRLLELDEAAKAETEPVVETAEVIDTPAEPEAQVEASPEPEPAPDPFEGKYVLDKAATYQELLRLSRDDENFRNNLNTFVGRTAKRQYEPEVDRLKAELDAANFELRRSKIQAMAPADIEAKFASDPQFAREYAEAVHGKGVDIDAVREQIQTTAAVNRELDRAFDAGVPKEDIEQVQAWAASGAFDHDPNSKRELSILESYSWMKDVIDQKIAATRIRQAPTAPAPAPRTEAPSTVAAAAPVAVKEPVIPQANARLSEATPDLSNAAVATGGRRQYRLSEWRQMNPDQKKSVWPTAADFERDYRDGTIIRD